MIAMLVTILVFVAGVFAGGLLGVFAGCLMAVAAANDRHHERHGIARKEREDRP